MMRCSRHNGRSGKCGSYNPKHNDREFDLDKNEELNKEMTDENVYWNCIDQEIVRHGERDDDSISFTEVEKIFYEDAYKDYLDGQNQRNIEARHKERCRTMDQLRESKKTCPEESLYQIGNINGTVDSDVLLECATEFFETIHERYGDHYHTLNWALHLDEATPHIHERHVFDVINQYGERQPKQEQALRELGFELPDPNKKEGKYNNRKMSFDAECRKIFIEICKEHGIQIEMEPIYGGRKYLEKQEYINSQINEKNQVLRTENTQLLFNNSALIEQKQELTCGIEKLDDERLKKEIKLASVDDFISDVTEIIYDKACVTVIDEVAETMRKEESKEISKLKSEIAESDNLITKTLGKFAVDQLTKLQQRLHGVKRNVVDTLKKTFSSTAKRERLIEKIKEEAKPSLLEALRLKNDAIQKDKKEKALEIPARNKRHEQCL